MNKNNYCNNKMQWDERLPENVNTEWDVFRKELSDMGKNKNS